MTATPTFFINGRMQVGAPSYEALVQAVDDELSYRGIALPGAEKLAAPKGKKKK